MRERCMAGACRTCQCAMVSRSIASRMRSVPGENSWHCTRLRWLECGLTLDSPPRSGSWRAGSEDQTHEVDIFLAATFAEIFARRGDCRANVCEGDKGWRSADDRVSPFSRL